MSRDAFLIGAGFSRAVSDHMPLIDELGRVSFHFGGRYAPGLVGQNQGVEELLTYFAQNQPWLSEHDNLMNRATFLEISQKIGGKLIGHEADALGDPMPDWLRAFVSRLMVDRSGVVSLNYDTLIEHAYTELLPRDGPPELDYAAHAQIYGIPVQSAMARRRPIAAQYLGQESLRLLKLHGSLNWCYSGSEMAIGEEIYDRGIMPGWTDVRLPDAVRSAALDKVTLLIPPTLGKSAFFTNETVRSMWRAALWALNESKNVYILGYSLPPSDHNMLGLLRTALDESKTVYVVNRDPEAGNRHKEILGDFTNVDTSYADVGVEPFAVEYVTT